MGAGQSARLFFLGCMSSVEYRFLKLLLVAVFGAAIVYIGARELDRSYGRNGAHLSGPSNFLKSLYGDFDFGRASLKRAASNQAEKNEVLRQKDKKAVQAKSKPKLAPGEETDKLDSSDREELNDLLEKVVP